MKILHITDTLRSGGKERQLVELLKGLSSRDDIQSEVITMSDEIHYKEIFQLNVKVHSIIRSTRKDFSIFHKVYNLCKSIRPDIIQTWGSFASLVAVPVARLMRIKFINGTIRKAPEHIKPFSEDWIRSKITFLFSDRIVANSQAGLHSYNAPYRKSLCIYNGFDFDRINNLEQPDNIRKKLGITTNNVVGMVASFSQNKDYKTFITSAQSILKKRKDVTFLCLGDGPTLSSCTKMVIPEFQDKILFLGRKNNIESIINVFDIGILATFTEGQSNSIMEYMALGKSVVATRNSGNSELIVNHETGILVEQENPEELSKAVLNLLDNKYLRNNIGLASKQRIANNFSSQKMTQSYIILYNEVLKK